MNSHRCFPMRRALVCLLLLGTGFLPRLMNDQRTFARTGSRLRGTGRHSRNSRLARPTQSEPSLVDGGVISFSSPSYSVNELAWGIIILINRSGDLSQAVTVDYATSDLTADSRKNYAPAHGTARFDAGSSGAALQLLVNPDKYADGGEKFQVTLSNPTNGAVLGSPSVATVQIDDTPLPNQVDSPDHFVRQHYNDFLNRLAGNDLAGLQFWTNQITDCQAIAPACNVEERRINVSASFFLSIEFQQTGYLVERFYKVAYGDRTSVSAFNGTHPVFVPIVRFEEFLPDTQEIGRGFAVGIGPWQTTLENNKAAFATAFVQRPRFVASFPLNMTADQFVDKLNQNGGSPLSKMERDQLVVDLSNNLKTRAQVVRVIAENATLANAEFSRAFVLTEYFGYLRRNPDDAPDGDYTGYDFWLTKLSQFNGNYINAEMVKAFISSVEYRQRFGP